LSMVNGEWRVGSLESRVGSMRPDFEFFISLLSGESLTKIMQAHVNNDCVKHVKTGACV